jgi:hypothetical protein
MPDGSRQSRLELLFRVVGDSHQSSVTVTRARRRAGYHHSVEETRTFQLKPMVMVRLLAEATVLVVLIIAPIVLWIPGHVQKMPHTMQISMFSLSAVALALLPFYGFITYKVIVEPLGARGIALFSKQFVEWEHAEKLSLKTTLNWRRYVLSTPDTDLSFPVWLRDLPVLLSIIRSKLPESTTGGDKERTYRQDAMGQIIRIVQIIAWMLFLAMFWFFCVSSLKTLSAGDAALIVVATIIATCLIGWRCLVVATMPQTIKTSPDGLEIKTPFQRKTIEWQQCLSVRPSSPLLPEGIMLKTSQGSFLIAEDLDGSPELADELKNRLTAQEAVEE